MTTLINIIRYVDLAAFVALAILTYRGWRARRDEATRWAALTFGTLGAVAIVGEILPEEAEGAAAEWAETTLISILLLFPYCLFRLAGTFTRVRSRAIEVGATFLTAIVVVWAIALPRFPDEGEPRSTAFTVFVTAVLAQWVALSFIAAVRFWRAGSGQPAIARRRMRMLAVAATVLSVAIVLSGATPGDRSQGAELVIQAIVLTSVLAFFLAIAPPAWLRWIWRREAERELRRATTTLMSATNADAIADAVLPHAAGMVGGMGIAMYDTDSKLLGSFGFTDEEARAMDISSGELPSHHLQLGYDFGSLVVRADPQTPFFGEDDINLLGALGTFVNMAMKRLDAVEIEKQLAEAKIRRRQALEINDNVVQRLAVAHYSFELGQLDEAKKALDAALKAARRTISDLLAELPPDQQTDMSTLTRSGPATDLMSEN